MTSSFAEENAQKVREPILLRIYKEVDDPDAFYGLQQPPSFDTIIDKVDHEGDGFKALMLRSARLDSSLRCGLSDHQADSLGMMRALGILNLDSLTNSLIGVRRGHMSESTIASTVLDVSRRLDQWDVAIPATNNHSESMLFRTLQAFRSVDLVADVRVQLQSALKTTVQILAETQESSASMKTRFRDLAVLTEMQEVLEIPDASQLSDLLNVMHERQDAWDVGK